MFFDTLASQYGSAVTSQDEQVAQRMNAYWAAFAKTGNPSDAGVTNWPAVQRRAGRSDRVYRAGHDAGGSEPNPVKAANRSLYSHLTTQTKRVNRQYQ